MNTVRTPDEPIPRRRPRVRVGCCLGVIAGITVVLWGWVWFRHKGDEWHVADTVMMSASWTYRRLMDRSAPQDGLTQDEIDSVFAQLQGSSVSWVWWDDEGRPVDPWGSRFQVSWTFDDAGVCTVTVVSLGPDRVPDTPDDLVSIYTAGGWLRAH
jgi:hypothetical protein